MELVLPDRSQWKVDDKEWMKQHRAKWKEIREAFKHVKNINLKYLRCLKEYYLKGEISETVYYEDIAQHDLNVERKYNPEKPFDRFWSYATLLDLWLTADRSKKNLKDIVTRYDEPPIYPSQAVFLEKMRYYPEKGSLFLERDEEICHYLIPKRCRRRDYPDRKTEELFYYTVSSIFTNVILGIKNNIFGTKNPNPHNPVRFCLTALKDASIWKWKLIEKYDKDTIYNTYRSQEIEISLEKLFFQVSNIISNAREHNELAVEVAKELMDVYDDPKLPEPILKAVKQGLGSAKRKISKKKTAAKKKVSKKHL